MAAPAATVRGAGRGAGRERGEAGQRAGQSGRHRAHQQGELPQLADTEPRHGGQAGEAGPSASKLIYFCHNDYTGDFILKCCVLKMSKSFTCQWFIHKFPFEKSFPGEFSLDNTNLWLLFFLTRYFLCFAHLITFGLLMTCSQFRCQLASAYLYSM